MVQFHKPEVGEGATVSYPQDSYPYVVTSVSPSGKTIGVKPVTTVDKSTGHEPARYDGPFPVWSHTYTPEELQALVREDAPEQTVRWSAKGGYWTCAGTVFQVGTAHYHRNYSY